MGNLATDPTTGKPRMIWHVWLADQHSSFFNRCFQGKWSYPHAGPCRRSAVIMAESMQARWSTNIWVLGLRTSGRMQTIHSLSSRGEADLTHSTIRPDLCLHDGVILKRNALVQRWQSYVSNVHHVGQRHLRDLCPSSMARKYDRATLHRIEAQT